MMIQTQQYEDYVDDGEDNDGHEVVSNWWSLDDYDDSDAASSDSGDIDNDETDDDLMAHVGTDPVLHW